MRSRRSPAPDGAQTGASAAPARPCPGNPRRPAHRSRRPATAAGCAARSWAPTGRSPARPGRHAARCCSMNISASSPPTMITSGGRAAVLVAQVRGDRVAIRCATELRSVQKLGRQVHARVGMRRKCRVQASVELHVGRQQAAVGVQHQHVARFRGRGRNGAKQPQTHDQKTPQRVSQPRGRAMRSRTGSHNQGTLSFAGCGGCKR